MINQYKLDRLVVKTYKFVQDTVADWSKHTDAIVSTILALYDAAEIPYEREYFTQNIVETINKIRNNGNDWLLDPNYNPDQVFIS